ncbi:hypothetical protein M947_06660 [Sulfurimonas hongkongensis]|uniref:Lipoprotein LPP20-like domain-containing protein n=1 Tax=Sulfurimonas hongkongensis TaxID=1172190 RepID=T0JNL1_9BACT|nr:LPP20 family lipoprotein [Sulfurimonas hongkongensis]EQB39671.1 hypothetical protein M947_06660 [Sulfurimonas hongkongensis]
MIKTLSSIVLAGLVTATITGCGASPKVLEDEGCIIENTLAPAWACVPVVEGAYAGVGISEKSAAGMGHMRRVALANGRSDLAQQIQVQVKDKVETFTRATGVGSAEVVDQVNTAVSKQVAKVDLQGSKQAGMWIAPSGAIYMLVTVGEAAVNNEVKKAVKTSFKNDEALWQQFQAKNALEGLEKEFPTN